MISLLALPIFVLFCIAFLIIYFIRAQKWKVRHRIIVFGGFLCLVAAFYLFGGNYYPSFPLYSEVYIEHPQSVKLDYYDNPEWWDYDTLASIRKRIANYVEANPSIDPGIAVALKDLSIKKGMDMYQISLVIGEPAKKKILRNNEELWIYKGRAGGTLQWYYRWGRLRFKNGVLSDIEVQHIRIYK